MSHAQEDEELRTKIAKDLLDLPIGKNEPLCWDADVLVEYIAAVREQTLAEVREQMLELIGEDEAPKELGMTERELVGYKVAKAELRQKVNDL